MLMLCGCVLAAVVTVGGSMTAGEPTEHTGPVAEGVPTPVRSVPRSRNKPNFGPPPPGYVRITGEPVPDWKPGAFDVRGPILMDWQPLGPRPITFEYWSGSDDASGRVVSIAVHPAMGNIVYIASASGGVWKTTDSGANWTPLTDELSILNHGAVALDPSSPETVYVGTGEYTTGSTGDGLFRSTDGGASWTRIATTAQVGGTCSGIAVDPGNSNIIHVTGGGGYFRSIDGGANWTQVLTGACSSLQLDPVNPANVYVGRSGAGVYKSVNSGASFSLLGTGLPGSGFSRIVLALAASSPSTVYAAFISGSNLQGFYKTTNAGANWSQLAGTPNFPSPQAWYDCFVGVDPTNASRVFCGGVFPTYAVAGVIRSTNGGSTWQDITFSSSLNTQLHPDQHAIAFGPDGKVWVGNDGGVWSSSDGGNNWTNRNGTLTLTQNYTIALHPTDPNKAMTGTQDNGTVGREQNVFAWPQVVSGDGGFLAYDYNTPTRMYTTYVYLTVFRITTTSFDDISGPWGGDSRNFIAPLVMDPNDPHILLGGTDRVWRTTNAHTSATWSAISPQWAGTLNAIAVARGNSSIIYAGNTSGDVFITTNASTWNSRSTGLPSGQISDIFIDPADASRAYVSYYRTSGQRVMLTEDMGLSWSNVTGDLPTGVAARALEVDWNQSPNHLFVGSGAGVYLSIDGGATWTKDGADLPNVNIGDLAIDFAHGTITAGTYGRGAWRSPLPVIQDCPADFDNNGTLNGIDVGLFLVSYTNTEASADLNGDGLVNGIDVGLFLQHYAQGC